MLLVSVHGNNASSYGGYRVHIFSENYNAEGFMKSSWELSEKGTISWGVDAVYASTLWAEKLRLPIFFLLS